VENSSFVMGNGPTSQHGVHTTESKHT